MGRNRIDAPSPIDGDDVAASDVVPPERSATKPAIAEHELEKQMLSLRLAIQSSDRSTAGVVLLTDDKPARKGIKMQSPHAWLPDVIPSTERADPAIEIIPVTSRMALSH